MAAVPASAQSAQPQALPTIETKSHPRERYLSKLLPPPATVYDMIIQVIVGKDAPRTFQVHKGLLCYFSEYFARAFNNKNWQESEDGVVRLVDDDAQTFQLFYNWLYTGHIRDDKKTTSKATYEIPKITPDGHVRLVSEEI
ncbi:hypothetical protein E8E11_009621 [Didymella keratinophila]|nr:hypothetical protein E8E11_009621 [Didymella keratinophila]